MELPGEGLIRLYPQVKIYANGVFLIEFRMMSPEEGTALEVFIDHYVNLFEVQAEQIRMRPGLVMAAESNIVHSLPGMPAALRREYLELQPAKLAKRLETAKAGDFEFSLVPMTAEQNLIPGHSHDLSMVRAYIVEALEWALNAAPGRLRGRHVRHEAGNGWSSRPIVYLIEYEDQPDTLFETTAAVKRIASALLTRTASAAKVPADLFPAEDHRAFGDHSLFFNEAISVYMFSRAGIAAEAAHADVNWGHLIFEKQAIAEAFEFQRFSHLRLLDLSTSKKSGLDQCLDERAELDYVENWLQPSSFGELNAQLRTMQEQQGLAQARERIRGNIETGKQDYLDRRSLNLSTLALTVTIVLGLAAAPTIADQFSTPLLRALGWLHGDISSMSRVLLYFGTFVLSLAVAWALAILTNVAVRAARRH
jgi:hypothetical protein